MSNVKGAENFVTLVGQCTQANNLTCMQCNPNIITALFSRHLFHRSSADLTDKFVLSKPIINRVGSDLGRVKENRCVSSLARARPDQKTWVENCDPTTHGLTRDLRLTHFLWEKAHSTTLIYRRCLSFNPQPQNQLLRVPQQFKLSVLHPLVVYWVVRLCGATSASPTWNRRHISIHGGSPTPPFSFSLAWVPPPLRLRLAAAPHREGVEGPVDAQICPTSPMVHPSRPWRRWRRGPFLLTGSGAPTSGSTLHTSPSRRIPV
jgi:hypothetical protein